MKKMRRIATNVVILSLFVVFFFIISNMAQGSDVYRVISKNLTVLGEIYKRISTNYVDKIDPDKFFKAGIQGMLNTLDPYTNYIEKESKSQLQILTDGKYEGVGMMLIYRNNVVTVAEPPFLGTPAARAGIREGDRIIKVDTSWTKNLGFSKTSMHVRGPAGSEVTLTIKREGEPHPLKFTLIREAIKVEDLVYASEIRDGIGYLKLTRFSRNVGSDIAQAIHKMDPDNLKGLILDLRSNPGGMLKSAVDVSDVFLQRGKVIVSTKGRVKQSNRKFVSLSNPVYGEKPLIVLVNSFSASASEIVAGAIQDHDRGIVVGDTTFGKGLVQTLFPMTRETALKITTAKYYTPSGRCIQKRHYSSWESFESDSLKHFSTDNGRAVKAGGGIAPDVYVAPRLVSDYVVALRRRSLFFNFAVHYANNKKQIDKSVKITPDILTEFRNYITEKSFKYELPIEKNLELFRKEAVSDKLDHDLINRIDALGVSIEQSKGRLFDASSNDIKLILKQELASKYFGTKRSIEIGINGDPTVKKAIEIISKPKLYNSLIKKTISNN